MLYAVVICCSSTYFINLQGSLIMKVELFISRDINGKIVGWSVYNTSTYTLLKEFSEFSPALSYYHSLLKGV